MLLLGGCTLIDQQTFGRTGASPDAVAVARSAALPALPLLRIRFDSPDVDFQRDLQAAVDAVQSRKRDADFDVLAPLPSAAALPTQDAFAKNGAADTKRVALGLGYAGIDEDRIHVGFRNDPGTPPREVLVFVR